ncbi:MAG: hypothetical protein AB8G22_21900, partial [Saprospiraceae bacterium]
MMENYNFKKNQQQPASEDIAKHQDFDALLQQFETTAPPATAKVVQMKTSRRLYIWASAVA